MTEHPFAFVATYSTRVRGGRILHKPLQYALTEYKKDRDKLLILLSCLNRVAEVSELVGSFVRSGEMFHPLRLTAAEACQHAAATAKKAQARGRELHPVTAAKRGPIARSWWGAAWCENLERYADYESRLERGKRYLRTGTVIDLKIGLGRVSAKVQGRRKAPYKVEIRISPVNEDRCQQIIRSCSRRIESLDALLKGQFPEELKETFIGKDGLFPTPREISFGCSCPDWALMCKHVAAVLYGIAVRFDEDPLLFFTLRGIEIDHFVEVTLENSVESMLKNVDVKSDRIIVDRNWERVFGL